MKYVFYPLILEGHSLLQTKVCAWSTDQRHSLSFLRKKVVRLTDCLKMTIAVDWNVKLQTKPKPQLVHSFYQLQKVEEYRFGIVHPSVVPLFVLSLK